MKEQFIPYDLALELKDLGFDKECLGYYDHEKKLIYNQNQLRNQEDFTVNNQKDCGIYACRILAPLWQQAFHFYREKYNLLGNMIYSYGCVYSFQIDSKFPDRTVAGLDPLEDYYHNYEGARLECLKQLIKIVKDANKN